MNNINDQTEGKLQEIIHFAQENRIADQFINVLARFYQHLANGCTINLYADWAPYSLGFSVMRDGKLSFNGGIIYHGPHDNGGDGSMSTLSVSMDNDSKPHWSMHT